MKTMRKRLKVSEADNGFIAECYFDEDSNVLSGMPGKVKVFRDKKELQEFISAYFTGKGLEFIESNALQEEEMQDEGEM